MARPREFSENDLLDTAMHLFWQKGYAATTLAQIVAASGVNRASLYACHADKQSLFLAVLRHYVATVCRENEALLAEDAPAAGNIRRFFARLSSPLPPEKPPGCLLQCAATGDPACDQEIRTLVQLAHHRLGEALAANVRRAQEEGSLAENCEASGFSAELLALAQGIAQLKNIGLPRETLELAICSALRSLH